MTGLMRTPRPSPRNMACVLALPIQAARLAADSDIALQRGGNITFDNYWLRGINDDR